MSTPFCMFCKDVRVWSSVSWPSQQMFHISRFFASTRWRGCQHIRLLFSWLSPLFSVLFPSLLIFVNVICRISFQVFVMSEKIPRRVIYCGLMVIWTQYEAAELLQEVRGVFVPECNNSVFCLEWFVVHFQRKRENHFPFCFSFVRCKNVEPISHQCIFILSLSKKKRKLPKSLRYQFSLKQQNLISSWS